MASLRIFCLPEELDVWLAELSERHELAALSFQSIGEEGVLMPVGADCLASLAVRTFMMPLAFQPGERLKMNDVRSRPNGWLDVEPGQLSQTGEERILCYSEVVGEDFEDAPVHPARFVQALKRRIKKEAIAGTVGWNPTSMTQDEGVLYRDLWHTGRARKLYVDGVIWKQNPQYRVRFCPRV